MKKLTKYDEERVFKTPRMEGVKVSYLDDDKGNHVLTHTIIRSKPSVAVIVRNDGKVAFIRQFRSTTGKYYIEIPAGLIEDNETEAEAAMREVREETGLLVSGWILVQGPSLLDPSKSNENYGVAVMDVYGQEQRCLDETEQIDSEIIWMDEAEVFSKVKAQLFEGKPFYDELFMSGHSLYALMAYMMSK